MLHLLRHARVYSPEPLGVRDLLVAGGRIAWIGEDADLPPRLGAVTRDLEGRRVVPGLVDCHVHLTGGGGEAGYGTSVPPLPVEQFTRGGITSVVGLLGTDDAVRTVFLALEHAKLSGPAADAVKAARLVLNRKQAAAAPANGQIPATVKVPA